MSKEMDILINRFTPQKRDSLLEKLDSPPIKHRIMVQGHSTRFERRKDNKDISKLEKNETISAVQKEVFHVLTSPELSKYHFSKDQNVKSPVAKFPDKSSKQKGANYDVKLRNQGDYKTNLPVSPKENLSKFKIPKDSD